MQIGKAKKMCDCVFKYAHTQKKEKLTVVTDRLQL